MTQFPFPYRVDSNGLTAGTTPEQHVRDLIELVLFTDHGERVNRPEFGAGLRQMVFAENAPELASSAQHLVQSSLQQFLADLIEVHAVDVRADGARIRVTVRFRMIGEAVLRDVTVPAGGTA